jgi:hypothetical protein
MRARPLVVALFLAAMAVPGTASAIIVVRHPVYHPVATIATVAVVAAIVSKPPAIPPPPPSAAPPPAVTSPLPMDSTMWVLPSGCLKISVNGEPIYQCGPSWLKQQQSDRGPYYQVVPPPGAPPRQQ